MTSRNTDRNPNVQVVNEDSENNVLAEKIRGSLEIELSQNKPEDDAFHTINVMQNILDSEDLLKYMEQTDCCTCERCQADVRALSLTKLPSKYVVIRKNDTSPTISFYREKYRMDIISTIMRSAEEVKAHPHHGQERN
ncbi:MAG: late competence development ComFB family protein [Bacillota bacterium]|uniref:Late competence development protein ComFB n=1 Tax=[Clostridium] aminophilum TaxID=1526 RepID=A0A1I6IUJ8_9FIRM|nr:late competence development ComFB family protein [[Clostridium] aminophilum]MDT3844649.1 late competence development ComFB family protein [Bacillota bacterium]SFR70331.1 Late competence development protein ComFB [[Clostridium] aminophilum]